MILKNVLFLAAYTARSQAYAQAMAYAGFSPEKVWLLGAEKGGLPGQLSGEALEKSAGFADLFLPDLGISLKSTCETNGWNTKALSASSVNDEMVLRELKQAPPAFVIYSGYGGQIVSPELIRTGIPFLHIHGGWLPDFKGSTTLYYSWLEEGYCGASAVFLEEGIDRGPVLKRKKYPIPPSSIDPDYIYDCAIRADLLLDVLKEYASAGKLPEAIPQTEEGETYYVIHPVLKHLARLSYEKE
ncbi:MAG: methionyl-tRNA formyltransferase [Candidatus Omnitrophica bacterium]|nr:methionyl-tRNA formyltransferase [Candidatus Omnitrophota bacterium]